jgi:hypothetical protein
MSRSLGFFGLHCSSIALATAAIALSATIAAPVQAQDQAPVRIVIPAGKLPAMLTAIAHHGGIRIGFDHQRLADVTGQSVDAASIDEAIRQAIAGTSLLALHDKEGRWQITAPTNGEIVVRAKRNEAELSYDVNKSGSSTRDGKDLRSQPQATTVVTGKLMVDEQVQNLYEAMQNVAGATIDTGNVQGAATFNVRGFLARPLTDGLSNPGAIATPSRALNGSRC